MTAKTCATCKHCIPAHHKHKSDQLRFAKCAKAPRDPSTDVEVLVGIKTGQDFHFCIQQRDQVLDIGHVCGTRGQWWEPCGDQ